MTKIEEIPHKMWKETLFNALQSIAFLIVIPFVTIFLSPLINVLLPPNTSFTFQFIILLLLWLSFFRNIWSYDSQFGEPAPRFLREKRLGGLLMFLGLYFQFFQWLFPLVWFLHWLLAWFVYSPKHVSFSVNDAQAKKA
mmetsp:Transcript_4790/g.17943  ORF Transcript_4790/g.17943 Transcript_4790/m.17943 type:complete len:139 (-) Transcript_4790:901-1317(-)